MADGLKINTIQNSNNIKLIFTIKKDGRIEPLLGAIVKLQFIDKKNGYVIKRECTITDASAAECMYILTSSDLSVVGNYQSELEVQYSNGTRLTKQNIILLSIIPELISD
jgi:hypothetical protein